MLEIGINLVFEDPLSEAVMDRILAASPRRYAVGARDPCGGCGDIKRKINGYNHSAKGMAYLILTDLDRHECAPALINEWLEGRPRHHNLLFRVAVRQVEAWLLACRCDFARFADVKEHLIPADTDRIENSKKFLIDLVRDSKDLGLRSDIVSDRKSTARVGPNYNPRLISFVEKYWDPNVAKRCSPSLRRAMEALDAFIPVFGYSQGHGDC